MYDIVIVSSVWLLPSLRKLPFFGWLPFYSPSFTDVLVAGADRFGKLGNCNLEIKSHKFRNSLQVPLIVTSVFLTSWKFHNASCV